MFCNSKYVSNLLFKLKIKSMNQKTYFLSNKTNRVGMFRQAQNFMSSGADGVCNSARSSPPHVYLTGWQQVLDTTATIDDDSGLNKHPDEILVYTAICDTNFWSFNMKNRISKNHFSTSKHAKLIQNCVLLLLFRDFLSEVGVVDHPLDCAGYPSAPRPSPLHRLLLL
jgi:hypothetical protein